MEDVVVLVRSGDGNVTLVAHEYNGTGPQTHSHLGELRHVPLIYADDGDAEGRKTYRL